MVFIYGFTSQMDTSVIRGKMEMLIFASRGLLFSPPTHFYYIQPSLCNILYLLLLVFSDKTVRTDIVSCTEGANDVFVCACKKGYKADSTQCIQGEYTS